MQRAAAREEDELRWVGKLSRPPLLFSLCDPLVRFLQNLILFVYDKIVLPPFTPTTSDIFDRSYGLRRGLGHHSFIREQLGSGEMVSSD